MEDLSKLLEKFLMEWKTKKYVMGAILTGSRVTTQFSENSDIDVYIVLSPDVKWRERGNIMVDGMLIEYFANPPNQIRAYLKDEFEKNRFTTARMFAMGKILFDKEGYVKQLKKEAINFMKKKFKKPNKNEIELAKYCLWDNLDNLKDLYQQNSENFDFLYYLALNGILETYSKFLRVEIPPRSKILLYFENEKFRREYKFKEFPDKTFSEIFTSCLKCKKRKEKMELVEKLTNHVFERMHTFNIDGWRLRSRTTI